MAWIAKFSEKLQGGFCTVKIPTENAKIFTETVRLIVDYQTRLVLYDYQAYKEGTFRYVDTHTYTHTEYAMKMSV